MSRCPSLAGWTLVCIFDFRITYVAEVDGWVVQAPHVNTSAVVLVAMH